MISTMARTVITVVMATPNAMIDKFLWLFRNLDNKKDNLMSIGNQG